MQTRVRTPSHCLLQLERNERSFTSSESVITQSIDAELLRVSKSMPASFWQQANFYHLTIGSPESIWEIVRLTAQVYHYSLSIQLYLLYMIHGIGDNNEHEYSKITCVHAGREIMTRFIAHRSFNPVSSCSRLVDFFALLAAMTLLLAHLDVYQHQHREATNFLAQQRLSDRAMLTQAVERMDVISTSNKDATTKESAKLIRQLLEIEADAAEASNYTARGTRGDESDAQGSVGMGCEVLRLHIPYFGTIKIARQGHIIREVSLEVLTSCRTHNCAVYLLQSETKLAGSDNLSLSLPHTSPTDEQQPPNPVHGMVHISTFSRDLLGVGRPNAQIQIHGYVKQFLPQHPGSITDDITQQPDMGLRGIAASVDDWAFHGVDIAVFDSLMRASSCVGGDVLEQ